jgi:hypothetical protein
MSHAAVKIVADWLDGATNGLNACAAAVPRMGSDEAPPTVTVYNELEDAWVARGLSPDEADTIAGISFPACAVKIVSATWNAGMGTVYESGRAAIGTVQVAVELLQQNTNTIDAITDGIYLMRGLRASLMLLDNAAQTSRDEQNTTVCIWPSTGMQQMKMDIVRGDTLTVSALVITYPVWESTPATA